MTRHRADCSGLEAMNSIYLLLRSFLTARGLYSSSSAPLLWIFFPVAVPLILICASAVDVRAADWSFTPSVTVSESYNSNFQFTATPLPGTRKDDFITTVTPVVSISGETENTKFTFDTVTPAQAYLYNPQYDTVNTNTTASLTEIWSPRFLTSASFGFTHNQTLEQQLQASGIIALRTDQYQFTYGLGCTYGLSESVNLTVSGSYIKSIYPSGFLPESDVYQAVATPVWMVSERTNIGLSSTLSYTDYGAAGGAGVSGTGAAATGSTTIKSLTEMLFFERSFSETLSLKLSGGYYLSSLAFAAQTPEFIGWVITPTGIFPYYILRTQPATATEGGFVFSTELRKDWSEKFSTSFWAGKQQYNDVSGNSFDSMYFSGTAIYKLSELTTLSFTARYNTNDQISGGTQKIDYVTLSADIERNLTENISVKLGGSYEHEYQGFGGAGVAGVTNLNLGRYIGLVELNYKWPRILASH